MDSHKQSLNFRAFASLIGFLLIIFGVFLIFPFIAAVYFEEQTKALFLCSSVVSLVCGILLSSRWRHESMRMQSRDPIVFVFFVWVFLSLSSAIPYVLSGTFTSVLDAIFESVSGFTATGWSTLTNLETAPKSILLWRSLTQWMGGLGLILAVVAMVERFGYGANTLFNLEFRNPSQKKIHPHVSVTARNIYFIYFLLSFLLFLCLIAGKVSVFDSLCYTFSTISTGGFSLHDDGVIQTSPYVQYVLVIFMLLGSMNYLLMYQVGQGKLKFLFKDEQIRWYLIAICLFTFCAAGYLFFEGGFPLEKAFRYGLFQIVSVVSTTGFYLSNAIYWTVPISFLFFLLMFSGGCSGSASSSLKFVRSIILLKFIRMSFRRILHPQAIIPVKYNGLVVGDRVVNQVFGFFFLFLLSFLFGSFLLICTGVEFYKALSLSVSSLGNIGPVAGSFSPYAGIESLSDPSKGVITILMLIGRLEVYSFFAFFSKVVWS